MPFAVLSTLPITASAKDKEEFIGGFMNPLNHISKTDEGMYTQLKGIVDDIFGLFGWFKNLPQNVGQLSVDFLGWIYNLLTTTILHTPTFLFTNSWVKENILMFTGVSIFSVVILTALDGIKRILKPFHKKPITELKRVITRFPLILLGSALAPTLFYYGFSGLNYVTDLILNMTQSGVTKSMEGLKFNSTSFVRVASFLLFDVAVLITLIPVFLQIARRWFDLIACAMITPLALTSWIFKEYEHLFNKWWNHIKKIGAFQLVYAVFLLIIGFLMFGLRNPQSDAELLTGMLVLLGGFYRLQNPPRIVKEYFDSGTDSKGMYNGMRKSLTFPKFSETTNRRYKRYFFNPAKRGLGKLFRKGESA